MPCLPTSFCLEIDLQVGLNLRQTTTMKKAANVRGNTMIRIKFLMNLSVNMTSK